MKATVETISPYRAIRCPACLTHSRPLAVPWQQHVIGCPVRADALGRHREAGQQARVRMGVA